MKIFALETDIERIKSHYCQPGEREVLLTYYHGMSFFFAILREIFLSFIFIGIAFFSWFMGWPLLWIALALVSSWVLFVLFNVVRAYIDWTYDFILVTNDKVILVDQSSFFKQEVKPILIDNIGSVSTETQFFGLFPFGKITIHLKEGLGGDDIVKKYVPHAEDVTGKISAVVTDFQRRG